MFLLYSIQWVRFFKKKIYLKIKNELHFKFRSRLEVWMNRPARTCTLHTQFQTFIFVQMPFICIRLAYDMCTVWFGCRKMLEINSIPWPPSNNSTLLFQQQKWIFRYFKIKTFPVKWLRPVPPNAQWNCLNESGTERSERLTRADEHTDQE